MCNPYEIFGLLLLYYELIYLFITVLFVEMLLWYTFDFLVILYKKLMILFLML